MQRFFIFLICTFTLHVAVAQNNGYKDSKEAIKGYLKPLDQDSKGYSKKFRALKIPNNAFKKGEVLKYEMRYGFVTGAELTATLTDTVMRGQPVLHSYCLAKTVGLANSLFGLRDVYESYFDPETNLPLKAIRNLKEGRYRFYNDVDFYHDIDSAYSKRSKKFKKIPHGVMDLVAAFYYSRRVTFNDIGAVGDTVRFQTWFDDRIFELKVVYRGFENVKTEVGKIRCMKFNPIVEKGVVQDVDKGVSFWVSVDKNYIPIRAEMQMMIGAFRCDLVSYKNLMHPLTFVKD